MASISQKKVVDHILRAICAETTTEKGRIYEDLIIYIMSQVAGISSATRDTLNPFHSEETDIVFWNEKDRRGLSFLPSRILTEVKGWSSPVGSNEISFFETKLRERNANFGLFVAMNGVTGFTENTPQGARDLIRMALSRGIEIVVLTGNDLLSINSGADFVALLKDKLCQIHASGTQVS